MNCNSSMLKAPSGKRISYLKISKKKKKNKLSLIRIYKISAHLHLNYS